MAKKWLRFCNNKRKDDFLNYLIQTGTITKAAKKAGIDRSSHYVWLQDEKYAAAYEKARKMAADAFEEEAVRRAIEGDEVKIYYKGEEVGSRFVKSDYLLAMILKGMKPEVYKEAPEVNVNTNINMADIVREARERVANAQEETGAD